MDGQRTFLVKHKQAAPKFVFFRRRKNLNRSFRERSCGVFSGGGVRSGASWRLNDSSRALKMAETPIPPSLMDSLTREVCKA